MRKLPKLCPQRARARERRRERSTWTSWTVRAESLAGVTFVTFGRGKAVQWAAAGVTFARNVVTFVRDRPVTVVPSTSPRECASDTMGTESKEKAGAESCFCIHQLGAQSARCRTAKSV